MADRSGAEVSSSPAPRLIWTRLVRSDLVRGLAVFSGGASLAQAFMLVYAVLLARHLTVDGYGQYAGSYAIAGLTSFLFNWGLDTWLLREAAIRADSHRITRSVLAIKGLFGIGWSLGLVTLLPIAQPGVYARAFMVICTLDLLCEGLFTAQIAFLNAHSHFQAASRLLMLSRGGRLLSAVVIISAGITQPISFAAARWAATLIALVVALITSRPGLKKVGNLPAIFKQSIPYGLSDLLAAIYLQADVTLLALLLGSKAAVGAYSPASGLINALFIIPNAVYSVILPTLMRLMDQRIEQLRKAVGLISLGFSGLGLALWAGTALAGHPVTSLILGQAYATTGELLVRLSPILFLKSLEFGCAALIVALGWQKHRLGPQVISAGINVLLNLYFIPRIGVWSVANVYVISEVVLAGGYVWVALRAWRSFTRGREAAA